MPADWEVVEARSKPGHFYYRHVVTHQTSWSCPGATSAPAPRADAPAPRERAAERERATARAFADGFSAYARANFGAADDGAVPSAEGVDALVAAAAARITARIAAEDAAASGGDAADDSLERPPTAPRDPVVVVAAAASPVGAQAADRSVATVQDVDAGAQRIAETSDREVTFDVEVAELLARRRAEVAAAAALPAERPIAPASPAASPAA